MPDGVQLDLLDWLAKAEKQPTPEMNSLPSRSDWWGRLIAGSLAAANVRIHVSAHWTGTVVEQINDPVLGRRLLWHTGVITEYPFTASAKPSRTVYMTADGVGKIGLPVTVLDRGEGYVRYRIEGAANG